MTGWGKLPALIEPVHSGCLNCGSKPIVMELSRPLCVGFGSVSVSRDGDPDHDWRVYFMAPLWEGEWQRHGAGEWVAVSRGMGFA